MTRDRRNELTVPSPRESAGAETVNGAGTSRQRRSRYASSPFLAHLVSERLRTVGLGSARAEAPLIHGKYGACNRTLREGLGDRLDLSV